MIAVYSNQKEQRCEYDIDNYVDFAGFDKLFDIIDYHLRSSINIQIVTTGSTCNSYGVFF